MTAEPVLVGVDFTAEWLRVLLTTENGRPVHEGEWALPPLDDEEAWSWEVGGRIAALFADEGQRRSALAIVVASPGAVEPITGRLLGCPSQPTWDGLSVVDALRRHIGAPIAAESRIITSLLAECWQGAAAGIDDVLYVSLRGKPAAAVLIGGWPMRGAHFEAGALPAMPSLTPGAPLSDEDAEAVVALLTDAAALLDIESIVIDGEPQHIERLVPLLQRVLDEVAPNTQAVAATLGERAAVIGAVRMASTLAFEDLSSPGARRRGKS